ncbi:MAG: hypothetical protein Q8R76_10050 [Candidatus Omnitrophota bacterium]|nr:hypothetical protein [Candidatus Omnitrophota bacterium]
MDVDFLVPVDKEYTRLIDFLSKAGYEQVTGHGWQRKGEDIRYDLFQGKKVFVTELERSPLEPGGHKLIKEFNKIYLGTLNPFDLLITKMARGARVDFEDCLILLRNEKLDLGRLKERFQEAVKYAINFGINEDQAVKNFDHLMRLNKTDKSD